MTAKEIANKLAEFNYGARRFTFRDGDSLVANPGQYHIIFSLTAGISDVHLTPEGIDLMAKSEFISRID